MSLRYVTWIDGDEAIVELVEVAGGTVRARIEHGDDTREVSLRVLRDDGGRATVQLVDGTVTRALARPTRAGQVAVQLGFSSVNVRVVSERDAWLGGADDGQGSGEVSVAMPGRVVKVLAAVGDEVEAGQPLLIIEAMKMENEVKAQCPGVVAALHVAEGDSVEADLVLMVITPAE